MQLVLAKSANSAASCVCSINNGTGGVSTGLSLMRFLLVGAAAQLVTQESGAYVMHLVTSCQLHHIVHTVRQMETKETLRRLMQHVQTVSKTHFYNKFLTSKNFGKLLGDPPPPLPCVQDIDPEVPLYKGQY